MINFLQNLYPDGSRKSSDTGSSLQSLLTKTRWIISLNDVINQSMSVLFYGFFAGTGVILLDRIGGELQLWIPVSTDTLILYFIGFTFVSALLWGLIHAYRSRCSDEELAWLLDRKYNMESRLLTGVKHAGSTSQNFWKRRVTDEANKIAENVYDRERFSLPSQGYRWMFLMALALDLLLVVGMNPKSKYSIPGKHQSLNASSTTKPSTPHSDESSPDHEFPRHFSTQTRFIDQDKNENREDTQQTDKNNRNKQKKNKDREQNNQKPNPRANPGESGKANKSGPDTPLYGEEKRHAHKRNREVVRAKSSGESGREGRVRIFDPDKEKETSENKSSKAGSKQNNSGGQQGNNSSDQQPNTEDSIIDKYRRLAEHRIRKGYFSSDSRKLIRRYFKSLDLRLRQREENESGNNRNSNRK